MATNITGSPSSKQGNNNNNNNNTRRRGELVFKKNLTQFSSSFPTACAWSPVADDRVVGIVHECGTVVFFDRVTQKPVFSPARCLKPEDERAKHVSTSDLMIPATATPEQKKNMEAEAKAKLDGYFLSCCAWSEDAKYFAVGGENGLVYVFDAVKTGREIWHVYAFPKGEGAVANVAFLKGAGDDRKHMFAVTGRSGTVFVDCDNQRKVGGFARAVNYSARACDVSPDGKQFVIAGAYQRITIWTSETILQAPEKQEVTNKDPKKLAITGHGLIGCDGKINPPAAAAGNDSTGGGFPGSGSNIPLNPSNNKNNNPVNMSGVPFVTGDSTSSSGGGLDSTGAMGNQNTTISSSALANPMAATAATGTGTIGGMGSENTTVPLGNAGKEKAEKKKKLEELNKVGGPIIGDPRYARNLNDFIGGGVEVFDADSYGGLTAGGSLPSENADGACDTRSIRFIGQSGKVLATCQGSSVILHELNMTPGADLSSPSSSSSAEEEGEKKKNSSSGGGISTENHKFLLGERAIRHGDRIVSVESSRGQPGLLVTASEDETVKVWNIRDHNKPARLIATLPHENFLRQAAVSPSGRFICSLSRGGETHVWSLNLWFLRRFVFLIRDKSRADHLRDCFAEFLCLIETCRFLA